MLSRHLCVAAAACALFSVAACSDSGSTTDAAGTNGTVVVKMTDAPFPTDSVSRVDVYVVRVDARVSAADSATSDSNLDNASAGGWTTIASPNAAFDLLSLHSGATATLGQATLAGGTYSGLRLIIDPTRSSVTLKNGTVLTGTSSPNVTFPSASKSGIKVVLANPVTIAGGATTTLLIDFDLDDSFVMRGNSISKNGLLFKPTVHASVTDAASVNATFRLVNATDASLTLTRNGTALPGASAIGFGTSSACNAVTAANPGVTVAIAGNAIAPAPFPASFSAGSNYAVVAYSALNILQFTTLRTNGFVPASGMAGIEVYNVGGLTTAVDLLAGPVGSALGPVVISNVATSSGSAFVSVPAGTQQLRLTATGTQTVLFDLGSVNLVAGQNAIVVIAPPSGSPTPRAFLATGC